MCGSSPDPDAVTASTGTGKRASRPFSARYEAARSATMEEKYLAIAASRRNTCPASFAALLIAVPTFDEPLGAS